MKRKTHQLCSLLPEIYKMYLRSNREDLEKYYNWIIDEIEYIEACNPNDLVLTYHKPRLIFLIGLLEI